MDDRSRAPHWISLANEGRAASGIKASAAAFAGPPPLLRGLSNDEVAVVREAGHRRIVARGARLFSQGTRQDGIFLLETGQIRVFSIGRSGREITLAYWYPGNFVGGPQVFTEGLHVWSGSAVLNSSVLHLPGESLRDLVVRIPVLGLNVIEGLSFKGRCYSALAQLLGTQSATERLAHLLLHMVDLYGVEAPGGMLIAAPFTRTDLAAMIGSTRQWVATSLKKFGEMGIVEICDDQMVVRSLAKLKNVRDGRSPEDGRACS